MLAFAISMSSSPSASSSDCSKSLPSRIPLVIRDFIQSRSETSFPAVLALSCACTPSGDGNILRCLTLDVLGCGASPSAHAGPFFVRGFITLRNSAVNESSPSLEVAPTCNFALDPTGGTTLGEVAWSGPVRRGRLLGLGAGASFTP